MEESILEFVRSELAARRGQLRDISRAMDPERWESYHSWLTKVADGRIPDPRVTRVERLANYLRETRGHATTS